MKENWTEKEIQMLVKKQMMALECQSVLSLAKAKHMAERAVEKAERMNLSVVFAVVDAGGNLLLLHRMEDAMLGSIDIALNKAYTANALRTPTHKLAEDILPGRSLYGLQYTNQGRLVVFGGGFPCFASGKIIGAIGVSGGTVEEDMTVAEYALG